MKPFSVDTLRDSTSLSSISLTKHSRFLAGGTNLVDLMKLQIESPEHLIDLSQWEEAREINQTENEVRVGAMVSNTALANYSFKQDYLSLLSQALLSGATVQLRNRATTAGNLLQKTRCYYFYDTSRNCNKRNPGSGCAAINSMNRLHAILGTSDKCIAAHPSDMAVAMTAFDANIEVINSAGDSRRLALRELYKLPGDTPHIETNLRSDELITAVSLPIESRGTHYYKKVRDRSSYAFALVSVAATVKLVKGRIAALSIAFGGVGTVPWHARKTENALLNSEPTKTRIVEALESELADATTFKHNAFKRSLLIRTATDVLLKLVDHQRANPNYEGALYVA